jgi:hypothetical protein
MTIREKAWKCWIEILKMMEKTECYMEKGKGLRISNGCGGQFVDIIQRYL